MVQLYWEKAGTEASFALLVTLDAKFLLRSQVLTLEESPSFRSEGRAISTDLHLFSCQIKWVGGGIAGGQVAYLQNIHKGAGRPCEFLPHLDGRRGKLRRWQGEP